MTKKILIIDAHPWSGRFCSALCEAYADGVRTAATATVETLVLRDHALSINTPEGEEVESIWRKIEDANHICLVFPNWWGGHPSLLQSFFERIMIPGKAFNYKPDGSGLDQLLTGRTAEIICTMDSPAWYYRFLCRNAGVYRVKRLILGFCGIKTIRTTLFGGVRTSTLEIRKKWIVRVTELGKRAATIRN